MLAITRDAADTSISGSYVKTEQRRGPQLEDFAAMLLQVDGAAT